MRFRYSCRILSRLWRGPGKRPKPIKKSKASSLTYSSYDCAVECSQEGADPHASENDDYIDSTEADKSGESAFFFTHQRVHRALTDIRANRLISGRCCRCGSGAIFLRT